MDRDYAGCYHLYEGALLMVRPQLSSHPDLQKAIDDTMVRARETPQMEQRAFVLREVIDKIRKAINPKPTTVVTPTPAVGPTPPIVKEITTVGKIVDGEKNKLIVMVNGKSQTFTVPDSAEVLINGKPGKLTDLDFKRAATVVVISKGNVALKVLAHVDARVTPLPAVVKETTAKGKIVNGEKGKLIVMVDGKSKTFKIPDTAEVLINGKKGKLDGTGLQESGHGCHHE